MSTPSGLNLELAQQQIKDNLIPAFLKKLKEGTDPYAARDALFVQINELLGALHCNIPKKAKEELKDDKNF